MRYPACPRLAPALLLATLLVACGQGNEVKPAAAPAGGSLPPPPEVAVIEVSEQTVDLTTELSGRLQAVRTALVRARVEGVVQKIRYTEGTEVKAGSPLFEIDPRTYRSALEAAQTDALVAQQNWQRNQALLDAKAISQQEFDASMARHKQAQAALSRAMLDLENALVQAPISGRIGRSLVTEGMLVGRGESTPLASIDQLDPILVNFTQTESEWLALRRSLERGELKAHATWKVQLIQADGRVYPLSGQLKVAEKTVDPNTGAVYLRAEFPNPKTELMPGGFVRIRLAQASMPSAITVPQRAVLMNAQGPYVLAVGEDHKTLPVQIQTGPMSGTHWVVKSGLKPGMRIVVDGLQKARPGTWVKPVELKRAP
jgi:membrane fusion protein (multidrug efflux system)